MRSKITETPEPRSRTQSTNVAIVLLIILILNSDNSNFFLHSKVGIIWAGILEIMNIIM